MAEASSTITIVLDPEAMGLLREIRDLLQAADRHASAAEGGRFVSGELVSTADPTLGPLWRIVELLEHADRRASAAEGCSQ